MPCAMRGMIYICNNMGHSDHSRRPQMRVLYFK